LGEGVIQTGLGIVLAAGGFGPYAIILPQVVVRLYSAAAFRLAAGRVSLGTPSPRLWPELIRPGVWLMLYVCLIGFQTNAMFLVIGSFLDARSTGFFSWGYQMASQAVFLLVINLRQVLIPMVVKLNGQPERQRAAFYRGVLVMTAVALAVCLVQAVAAGPLVRWFFGDRWAPSVPVIVWMSLALATTPLNVFGSAVLVGRAMNRAAALVVGSQALLVMAGAAAGGLAGNYLAVTYSVAGAFVIGNGLAFLVAASVLRRPGVRDGSAGVQLAPLSP
jgi:O-antigen/teichoic acid export membrane protein